MIKSSVHEQFFKKELSSLKVPVIAFINTSSNLTHINYPIVTNLNKSNTLEPLNSDTTHGEDGD